MGRQKAIENQEHTLLICASGTFKGSPLIWSIVQKEAYSVVEACERFYYLLMRPQGFKLFINHKNLIKIFAPVKVSYKRKVVTMGGKNCTDVIHNRARRR